MYDLKLDGKEYPISKEQTILGRKRYRTKQEADLRTKIHGSGRKGVKPR